ncbi:hypothetical protein ACFLYM_00525 [Chloroflexota bacterium]
MFNLRLLALCCVISAAILSGISMSCSRAVFAEKDNRQVVRDIAGPYSFNYASWEFQALVSSVKGTFSGNNGKSDKENILRGQVKEILAESKIQGFPPLNFSLEQPPYLLVISPRNEIIYLDRVVLSQQLTVDDAERIEKQVDELDLSSLVVSLGGFGGTYPPIVDDNAGYKYTINIVVEEWLHQYLAFKPLGFRYLLDSIGIQQHRDVAVMNETLAGIVSKELGSAVYEHYYKDKETIVEKDKPDFDFDAEMRETRKQVDLFLSQGHIEEAERYMNDRKEVFQEHGYNIRKLNQAYFAFHGIYGHDPASVSPINEDLKQLRAKSITLKDFLDKTSSMTSYNDLKQALRD